jgi:hypothetical protein
VRGKSAQWEVWVTVTIHDENHDPVSDATVSAQWSGSISAAVFGKTLYDGTVTFATGKMRGGEAVNLAVADVMHDTFVYDVSTNHDPDGESDGTNISITMN